MKLILLQNIKGVGRMGDVKDVSDGYGRNYLLANSLAKLATKGTLKESEALKRKSELELKVAHDKAIELAEKSKDIVLEFVKKSSKTGKLFASVTKVEIAAELSKAIGSKIDVDGVNLGEHGEHIKQEGEHMITVELASEIKIELKVIVKGE